MWGLQQCPSVHMWESSMQNWWEKAYDDFACHSQSASAWSKRKLWYGQSESESSDSDISEQSNFLDEHDVGHDDESQDETNDLEEIHYEDSNQECGCLYFMSKRSGSGK